jgi:O-antigen ligase
MSSIATASVETGVNRRLPFTYFGSASFYGILAVILLAALSYGIADVWHKSLFVVMISIFAGVRVVDGLATGSFRIAKPRLMLPLAGILILAAAQITPLPGVMSDISVDPYDTKVFLAAFAGVVLAFEILCRYSESMGRLKVLVALVLIVGLGSALFGILLELDPALPPGLLARFLEPEQGFGQFYNRNHFALLMEMPIGLLLGILIKGDLPGIKRIAGCVVLAILAYSIIAASSRGGLISLTALCFFAVFVHFLTLSPRSPRGAYSRGLIGIHRNSAIGKAIVAFGLSIVVVVLIWAAIGFVGGDYVVTRVEKIDNELSAQNATQANRNAIWHSTIDLIRERPILGSGFGTFPEAIPRFDRANGKFYLQQAHNEYLEVLASGGIVGFALFAVFGAVVTAGIVKNLRSDDRAIRPLCFGASIGIFGVMIHSFVDFGLHIMINALIFTVLIVIATAGEPESKDRSVYAR